MDPTCPRRAALGLALAVLALVAASCDDGGSPTGSGLPQGTNKGKIVYAFVATIDGSLEDAVHVLDLATGTEKVFRAVDSPKGGVTAARDGTIAELGELDDAVTIRLSSPDGTTRGSFIVREELSFATSGAAISPDGSRVAFSFDVALTEGRGARTYVCPTDENATACTTFDGVKDPAWAPDGRLLAVTEEQNAIFLSDAAVTVLDRVGPATLTAAGDPIMTADGKHIIFEQGEIPRLGLLDVTSGAVTALTEGGLGQFRAALSPDGKTLLFQQQCCGGLGPQILALYAIPFKTTTTMTPVALPTVADSEGGLLAVDGRVAWF